MTEDELADAHEALRTLRERDQEYLADRLGGEPEDHRHDAEGS